MLRCSAPSELRSRRSGAPLSDPARFVRPTFSRQIGDRRSNPGGAGAAAPSNAPKGQDNKAQGNALGPPTWKGQPCKGETPLGAARCPAPSGRIPAWTWNPGRCPGLSCPAPSELRSRRAVAPSPTRHVSFARSSAPDRRSVQPEHQRRSALQPRVGAYPGSIRRHRFNLNEVAARHRDAETPSGFGEPGARAPKVACGNLGLPDEAPLAFARPDRRAKPARFVRSTLRASGSTDQTLGLTADKPAGLASQHCGTIRPRSGEFNCCVDSCHPIEGKRHGKIEVAFPPRALRHPSSANHQDRGIGCQPSPDKTVEAQDQRVQQVEGERERQQDQLALRGQHQDCRE